MSLWVVRHAQPLITLGTCYGVLDVPADIAATQQSAEILAAELPHGIVVQSSTLRRCEQLAQALCGLRSDLTLIREPRLVEMNFGIHEGVAWADIPKASLDAWTADFSFHRFGGQESVAEFMGRVAAVWDVWRAQASGAQDQAWIAHAGVARVATLLQQGVRLPKSALQWPVQGPGFGQWIVLPN